MAKSVIRLTPEEAKRRREKIYISSTLSGMGRRQNKFLDTYGSDYLSQYRTQDELDRYYADMAARAEDARLLRYYTAAYGDEESKKSLPDLDETIRGYDRVLSGKDQIMKFHGSFPDSAAFDKQMSYYDFDIEGAQKRIAQLRADNLKNVIDPKAASLVEEEIATLESDIRNATELQKFLKLSESNEPTEMEQLAAEFARKNGMIPNIPNPSFEKIQFELEQYLANATLENIDSAYMMVGPFGAQLSPLIEQRRAYLRGQENPFLSSAASVGMAPITAIDSAVSLAHGNASRLSDRVSAMRAGVSADFGEVGKFFYNTVMSGLDSIVGGLISIGTGLPLGEIMLGLNAAGSAFSESKEKGMSDERALSTAIVAGVAESLFEHWTIGNMKFFQPTNAKTFKALVSDVGKSMFTNFTEEAATELTNILYDTFVNTDFSDYQRMIDESVAKGIPVSEAKKEAAKSFALQIGEAGLSGAIMGAGFSALEMGTGAIASQYNNNQSYQKIGSEIRNTADADRILAEYVENAKKSGGKAAKAAAGYEKIEPRLDVKEKKKNVAAGKLVTEAAKAKFMSESRKNATENLEDTHKKAEASASNAKTAVDLADAGRKSRPKIVSIEGSELSDIKVEIDGEQKTAADITFEEETNYPLLYAYAPMLGSVHAANEFIQRYGGQKDIHRYFDDFMYYQLMGEAAGAGKWESILKAKRPGVVLDVPDMYAAMQTGLEIRDAARKQKTEDAKKIAQEWKRLGGTEKSGKLDTTELRTYSMDEHQASVVEFARVLTEAFGFNITFYATKKGERSRGDGYFDAKTNTIHLDIEAGINEGSSYSAINSALLSTLSHEIVHSMAVNTPEQYGALRDFLVDWYAKQGDDFEAKVLDLMDEQGLEREDAIEELIALTCEDLLYSSDALTEAMKEFYKKDEKAAKTFLDKLKEILEKILAFFNFAQKNRSAEASALEEGGKKVIMEAQKRFDAALLAIREANMANNAITEMDGLDTEAVTVSEDGTIKLRQRQYRETGRETLSEYLTEQYGADMAESMIFTIDNIYDIVDQIQEENPDLQIFSRWQETETELDEEGKPIFTTNIQNGDYPLNQDFSRVCKKRRQLDAVLNWLAAKDDFDVAYLTKDDYRKINEAISSHGYEVACALCFVDAKRFRQSEWADSFAQTWNDILTSIVAPGTELTPFNFATDTPNMNDDGIEIDGSRSVTYRKWSHGKEDVKNRRSYKSFDYMLQKEGGKYVEGNTNVRHIAELIRDNPQLRHTFRGADIISSKGFDTIQRLAPSVRQILNGWGGTSAPKTSSLDAGYDNSILNISGYNKEAAFSVGGVRMNSFSDFIAHMFFDYAQAFADLYAKGLPMQAYSKELDFFRLFGKTGGKLNMSGIPAPRDGNKSTWNVEKRFAGLNVDKVSEALGKPINKLTVEDCLNNLDLCEYVWAKESIDIKKATLLQSGILYDKFSDAKIDRCYALIQEGKMDEALSAAGDNVDTAYAENIGIIVVGVSEPHIRKMLRDPTIRMVIPYHKSGLNPQIARSLGIYAFVDYTGIQSTRVQMKDGSIMNLSSASDIKNAIGGDFKFYDYFGKTIDGVLYDGKRTAQKYLEWCEENSTDEYTIIPKFKDSKLGDFTTEENYYKLLEDFDCYNTLTGEHAPQNAVYFGEGALPDDYKDVLVRALKAEQKVSDDFRAELDGTSLREEILDIVRKRGYQGDKYRIRKVGKDDVVWIEDKVILDKNIPTYQAVANYLASHIGEVYTIIQSGQKVYLGKDLPGEYTQSKYTQKILRIPSLIHAKNRAVSNLGEMIEIATKRRWTKDKGSGKKDARYGVYKYKTTFAFPVYKLGTFEKAKAFNATLVIINSSDGKKYLYDVVSIRENTFVSVELSKRESMLAKKQVQNEGVSKDIIPQKTDLSRGNEKNIKNRLRKQTPEANEVLQAIFEEDPDLVGYADHKRELKKYKKLMDDREVNLEKIADLDDEILTLKSERKQSGKGTRMYELTSKRDILEKDVNELQRRMFEMEAKELNKVIKRKTTLVAAKARKEANEKAREKSKERTENIAKRKYINRVQERAKDMMDLLEKNSQKEHIPDAIKEPIADFLDSLNFASKRSTEGGAKTKKEIRLDEKMERVKEALEGKEFHSELNLPPEFMEEFDALVKTVRDIATHSTDMGGFTLEAMTSEELKDLNRMLIILKKSVNQMNALIVNARFANAKAAAEDSILAFGEQSEKGGIHGKSNAASDFLNYDNITPVFFFERMGEAAYSMFESIVDGQNMMARLADQLLKDSKKMFSEKEVQAWRKDIRHLTVQGKDVYISIPQIMYLYAMQKREQSYSHIHGAGIVVEDQDKSLIDQIKEKKNGPMKNTARGFNITEDEVDSIVSLLNDRQKEVADALQKYMSTVGSEWGNYVSMRRFGIHSFTERNYVPIYTVKATDSEQETKKSTTRMDLYSLLNKSFTHSLKKDANNRAVIKDLFDVFSDHMVDMATYRSFALPLLDILKWRDYEYNVDTSSVELPGGKTEVALKDYMTDAYGEAAWNYLTNLLKDLNGAQQTGRGEGLARRMISNYKVAAVAANLRVALLQGTSYIRAANAMDVRDLSHVLSIFNTKENKRGYLLALEWCGLVKWKDLGYFQVDISDPLAKKITGENSVRDTVVDWSMMLAEMGDKYTIGNLWNALERETKRKRPDLAPGSKEFNEHVAKRLTEVILKTQVIDSVVTKSQVMRSKGGLVQVLSSFMSEPTLSYNNVVSNAQIALDAKKRGDAHAQKKALKGFCKSVSVFAIGAVMQAVVGSISDALRDDDEEKNLGEKYLKNLMYNALGELNPMGSIVFVKELEPILNNLINKIAGTEFPTYTSGRMDTAFVSSVITASNKIFKMFEKGVNSDSFMQSTYALLKAVSQISGLPISNLIREVVSLWNSVVGLIDKDMVIELQ